MEKNEVESYANVKEYLIAKGLYDRVMEIEWDDEVEEYECFSDLYLWANTEEDISYWDEIDEDLRDLDINMNIESLVQDYKAKQEQELKQIIEEEQMKDNEVETYKDVKEYLVAKGLYEDVLSFDIDFNGYSHYFGNMFWYNKTPQGHEFWNKINIELIKLKINDKLDEILEDYEARKLETQPEEIQEEAPEQSTKTKPKQYLVFVPTKGKPKHIHQSLESAQEEAKRLCKRGLCEVMVLEVVSKYQAKVIVEEV